MYPKSTTQAWCNPKIERGIDKASTLRIGFFDRSSFELSNHRKGALFEMFARDVLAHLGYADITLRRKHSSLEYDIEASHRATTRIVVGEGKAHERSIAGAEIAAFVGKVAPLSVGSAIDALFLSVSSVTADGIDYLESEKTQQLLNSVGCKLRVLYGKELAEIACEISGLPKESELTTSNSLLGLVLFETWLIVSEGGWFIAQTLGSDIPVGPTHVAFFSSGGQPIRLSDLHTDRLVRQIPDFGELAILDAASSQEVDQATREQDGPGLLPGVVVGTGWFDYRLPAPRDHFIGRETALDDTSRFTDAVVSGQTSLRVIQILSRSGVGKSSLLVQLPRHLSTRVAASVEIDGRSIRAPMQVRQLVSQAIEAVNGVADESIQIPTSQDTIFAALSQVRDAVSGDSVVFVGIDQFESLLPLPAVFSTLLDLIVQSTEAGLPILWCLARKNDVTVTYDDSANVDLSRLNELSHESMLRDFAPEESERLLEALDSEIGGLRAELRESILTFSGGFPWLLKRVCAHVFNVHSQGVTQNELIRTGLRADDLFEEDMAGLTEHNRALLRTIAGHLPATSSELSRRLEGELGTRHLADQLGEFLSRRLMRLSGDVYDTYNDVFKTYLVTGRVPFQAGYVLRVTPSAAVELVRHVAAVGPVTFDSLHQELGGNQTALMNKLRDVRILGLVDNERGQISVTPEARASLDSSRLGHLLRRRLMGNSLVSDIHQLLLREERISSPDVASLLEDRLSHVEAKESTWTHYAKVLISWLRFSGLVATEGDYVRLREVLSDAVVEDQSFYLGTFEADVFVPSVRPNKIVELILYLDDRGATSMGELRVVLGKRDTAGAVRDADVLGLTRSNGDQVELSPQGRALCSGTDGVTEARVASLALAKPNVLALIEEAQEGPLSIDGQRGVMERFGTAGWALGTWKWRLGILRAWLVRTGQVRSTRKGLVAT